MRDFAKSGTENWLQARAAETCLAIALSPAFAWMAPFGTDEGSFFERLAFWGGLLSCWFLVFAATEARLRDLRLLANLPPTAQQIAAIALAALPMILITGIAVNNLEGWQVSFTEVIELYVQIIVIGSGATLLAKAILQAPPLPAPQLPVLPLPALPLPVLQPAEAAASSLLALPPAPSAPPPLIARLPPAVQGPILCLEMEDHYVRVHTVYGSALLLLRLSDAIAETSPVPGRQVHRSWWVSDAAVENFHRLGRVGVLQLSNGMRAPVSQRYVREVQASFCGTDPQAG